LVTYLRERLDSSELHPLPLHELIARIPFSIIVHAGWDDLLERALTQQGISYDVAYSAHDLPYLGTNRSLILYKPYGSLDRPESLIITEDDQLTVTTELRALTRRLYDLVGANTLLIVGYAPDYDSVFIRIYHEAREDFGGSLPPSFVIGSVSRPEDALEWEARGILPLANDPVDLLRRLALDVARIQGRELELPPPMQLSAAPRVTNSDVAAESSAFNQVLDTLGVGELVEQSDIPLLDARQARDLEAMRAAYERLTMSVSAVPESARVWLRQGNLEYVRANYEQARRYYEQALSVQPDLAQAYHNLYYVELAMARWEPAFIAYQRAVALSPDLALFPTRFRAEAILGQAGTGVVFRALDTETDKQVAIKVMKAADGRNQQAAARFQREIDLLQKLHHPNIVRVLEMPPHEGNRYLVMEYLGEETLARRIQHDLRLPLDEAFNVFQQACSAMTVMHHARIIHRDIRPSNIFLVEGEVKLASFELAASVDEEDANTERGIGGDLTYRAPEQLTEGAVDGRADVFALATIFYEMIIGIHPAHGAYRPPHELVPGLTEELDVVLQKARERHPDARFGTIKDFCEELSRVVRMQPASQQAPYWLKFLSRLQRGILLAVNTYWPVIFLVFLALELVLPAVLPWPAVRKSSRIVGFLLLDTLSAAWLTHNLMAYLARRSGYASTASFAALLGAVAGASFGGLLEWAFRSENNTPWDAPTLDSGEYLVNLMFHIMLGGALVMVSILTMVSGARLARLVRVSPALGALLGYIAFMVLFVLGLLLLGELTP
jgi:tetratricopeptide (TPR) repeat protein